MACLSTSYTNYCCCFARCWILGRFVTGDISRFIQPEHQYNVKTLHVFEIPSIQPKALLSPCACAVCACVCESVSYHCSLNSPPPTPLTVHHVLNQAPEWVFTLGDRVSWIVIDNSPSQSTEYSVAVCTQRITMLTHSDTSSSGTQNTGECRPAPKLNQLALTNYIFNIVENVFFLFHAHLVSWQTFCCRINLGFWDAAVEVYML